MTKYKVTCKECGGSDIVADFYGSMDASDFRNGVGIKRDDIGDVTYFCHDCNNVVAEETSVEAQEK